MSIWPTPDHEGHYWAMLVHHPDPDSISVDWEVVQVWDNNGNPENGGPPLMVSVPGIQQSQPLSAFEWGPEVPRPRELA